MDDAMKSNPRLGGACSLVWSESFYATQRTSNIILTCRIWTASPWYVAATARLTDTQMEVVMIDVGIGRCAK
jgi:hypothetical protein